MRWALGDPDRVLAARERAPIEPAVARDDGEAAPLEQVAPLEDGEPRELHLRLAVGAADGEGEGAGVLVPAGALEDAGLALDPAPVRLLDVLAGGGEDVEDELSVREEELVRRRQGAQAIGLGIEVEERPEGARHERDALGDGRLAEVALTQVEASVEARGARRLGADGEHPRRGVDADHGDAGARDRDRDPPRPDAELDDRPARGERLLDVELDVLGDAPAPRVVEPRDRVVGAGLGHALAIVTAVARARTFLFTEPRLVRELG